MDDAAFYDAMWTEYAHLDAVSPAAFHRRRLVVALARQLAPGARRILDAGCGPGNLVRDLAHAFPDAAVAGGDVSPRSLEVCASKTTSAELVLLDLAAPDFAEAHAARLGAYDLVVCSEVLEHLAADHTGAQRLVSLLAPGGLLIATVPGGTMSAFDVAIGHHRHYRSATLRALLEGAGLRVERDMAWGFPFHSAYRSMVRVASRVAVGGKRRSGPPGRMQRLLGESYALVGRALKPAFYLNVTFWGEQLIAAGRKAHDSAR